MFPPPLLFRPRWSYDPPLAMTKRLPYPLTPGECGTGPNALGAGEDPPDPTSGDNRSGGGVMAKRHGRPSVQYRYEHYDPRVNLPVAR